MLLERKTEMVPPSGWTSLDSHRLHRLHQFVQTKTTSDCKSTVPHAAGHAAVHAGQVPAVSGGQSEVPGIPQWHRPGSAKGWDLYGSGWTGYMIGSVRICSWLYKKPLLFPRILLRLVMVLPLGALLGYDDSSSEHLEEEFEEFGAARERSKRLSKFAKKKRRNARN